jgi:uncharacterized protein YndB with AHSA1/START domain
LLIETTAEEASMIRRELWVPAGTDRVWEAITEPDALQGWFGAAVEWDLRPGGRARFHGGDGDREGVVRAVEPGRHLRFVWWPSGDDSDLSEVAYDLEGDDDGTLLRVTERRLSVPDRDSAVTACRAGHRADEMGWSGADLALLHVWAAACGAAAGSAPS